MNKIFICVLAVVLLSGCTTTKVETTKPWEGHYMSTNDFYMTTTNIKLDKDESIWVLSNSTLKRLLKNVGK